MASLEKQHILFSREDDGGCSVMRLQFPLEGINQFSERLECRWAAFKHEVSEEEFQWADLFVIQRKNTPNWLQFVRKAHKYGKPVVYEVDDAILDSGMPPHNPGTPFYDIRANTDTIKKIMAEVDGFTTTTSSLKQTFDRYTSNCVCLPNSLPMGYITNSKLIRPSYSNPKNITIAWMTSSFHYQDVEVILPAITHIVQKYKNVSFLLIGWLDSRFKDVIPLDQLAYYPWILIPEFYHTYRKLPIHLQLAPLKIYRTDKQICKFNEGKSNLKILDGACRKTATIASPSAEYIKHRNNDAIVLETNSTDEWISSLEEAIHHLDVIKELGDIAYENLLENYNMDKNWILWENYYLSKLER